MKFSPLILFLLMIAGLGLLVFFVFWAMVGSSPSPLENTNVVSEENIVQQTPQKILAAEDTVVPITIMMVGDTMLGRYVEDLMKSHGEDYPFEKIVTDLEGYDVVFTNLEGPIMAGPRIPFGSLIFRFPEFTAEALARNHITHVSLANNHTLNQGQKGLDRTRELLTQAGVSFFGDPILDGEFSLVKDIQGKKLGFVGVNAAVREIDEQSVMEEIQKRRKEVDILFVSPHWGLEYQHTPSTTQIRLAHAWIDAGADFIVGHHPHVIQSVELYRDRLIVYSLGNFIFDQYFSVDVQEMLAIDATLREDEWTFRLLPLISTKSQPRLADGERRQQMLQKIAQWSDMSLESAILKGEFVLKRPSK